nr:MAG TPA: hypothetical protein [Caudoviricetes sp.]
MAIEMAPLKVLSCAPARAHTHSRPRVSSP